MTTDTLTKNRWVYSFGGGGADGDASMKNLLGGKGANLAEMCALGLPVPPGFTITTETCVHYYANGRSYPADLEAQVRDGLAKVEKAAGKTFGDPSNPLLVSVRSGARASMPGMMDTVLNLGLNDETVAGLAKLSGGVAVIKVGAATVGRQALRLRQLSPLHPDVFERGARPRPPYVRGDPRRP